MFNDTSTDVTATTTIQPAPVRVKMTARARLITGAALILSAAGAAGAAGVEGLITEATTGAAGLGGAVITIATVAVTIGLGWWAASKLRPKA